jgi:phospholipase C
MAQARKVVAIHGSFKDLQEPWHYTIGADDRLVSEDWQDDGPLDAYDLTLRGPSGFWRRYAGLLLPAAPRAEVLLAAHPDTGSVELLLRNAGTTPLTLTTTLDEAYPAQGPRTRQVSVRPQAQGRQSWPLGHSDLTVTLAGAPEFVRRFAGKAETGKAGRTDPGIGSMRLTV